MVLFLNGVVYVIGVTDTVFVGADPIYLSERWFHLALSLVDTFSQSGERRLQVIKVLRQVSGLDLREAKNLGDAAQAFRQQYPEAAAKWQAQQTEKVRAVA